LSAVVSYMRERVKAQRERLSRPRSLREMG